ncbi:hypothetical protein CBS63078_67 [Aspergillus niger]|nr:hypothetical protein CBS133816_3946 [Aspergillus niger]KAI2848096.1 hypothetical protein CBS11232_6952 [Aspergillus niger]KAI2944065.1 hypothetical protein CBS63078_67 [Aspergillus niger]KAI3009764.1 hypothetical protein CBS147346_2102 [Aspergillus niger]KAI3076110.1 hypothetical protein CBS147353_4940 [Aspergillus niger]
MPYYVHLQEHVVDGMLEPIMRKYYLMTAANATAAEKFLVGLQKYARTPNTQMYNAKAVTLEWWNCKVSSAGTIRWIYNEMIAERPENYNYVQELTDCCDTILISDLEAVNWPILPVNQETSQSRSGLG